MARVRTNCGYDIGILWVYDQSENENFQGRFYMTAQVLWVDLVYWRKVVDGYCFFFHFVIVLLGRMVGPFPIVFDILWTLKSCFPFIFKNHVEPQVMFSIFSASCWSSSHVIFCHFLIRPSSAWGVMVILHRSSKQYVWWDQKWHFCGRSHCSPQSLNRCAWTNCPISRWYPLTCHWNYCVETPTPIPNKQPPFTQISRGVGNTFELTWPS